MMTAALSIANVFVSIQIHRKICLNICKSVPIRKQLLLKYWKCPEISTIEICDVMSE